MGIKHYSLNQLNSLVAGLRKAYEKHLLDASPSADQSNSEAFLLGNPLAPVIGTICDEQINYEHAWAFPLWLSIELGQLDFSARSIGKLGKIRLAQMLEMYMDDRWPSGFPPEKQKSHTDRLADFIVRACELISEACDNNPDKMFQKMDYAAPELYFILRSLPGVGNKKAAMVVQDFAEGTGSWYQGICQRTGEKLKVRQRHHTEVPVDVHVVKVYGRLVGEFARTPPREDFLNYWADIQNLAKHAFPDCPSKLDRVLWPTGRDHCHDSRPDCGTCPLSQIPCSYAIRHSKQNN